MERVKGKREEERKSEEKKFGKREDGTWEKNQDNQRNIQREGWQNKEERGE